MDAARNLRKWARNTKGRHRPRAPQPLLWGHLVYQAGRREEVDVVRHRCQSAEPASSGPVLRMQETQTGAASEGTRRRSAVNSESRIHDGEEGRADQAFGHGPELAHHSVMELEKPRITTEVATLVMERPRNQRVRHLNQPPWPRTAASVLEAVCCSPVAWLERLDRRSRSWPTPVRCAYLCVKWYLVVTAVFACAMLAREELSEDRVALGTGVTVASSWRFSRVSSWDYVDSVNSAPGTHPVSVIQFCCATRRGSAGGGDRTHTPLAGPGILSPVRLPVSPPRPAAAVSHARAAERRTHHRSGGPTTRSSPPDPSAAETRRRSRGSRVHPVRPRRRRRRNRQSRRSAARTR